RTPRRLRLPALCAVQAPQRRRERRLWPARAATARAAEQHRDPPPRRRIALIGATRGPRPPHANAALWRTAPAGGARPRPRRRTAGTAARRAVRRARRAGAARPAPLAARTPRPDRPHHAVRHP